MSWYVWTVLAFEVNEKEPVVAAAQAELALSEADPEYDGNHRNILRAIASGDGYSVGWKGGGWAVAHTGNYTHGDDLATRLIPFFQRIWSNAEEGGMFEWGNAVLFTQDEQTPTVRVFQISYPGLVVERESGPWGFNGWFGRWE